MPTAGSKDIICLGVLLPNIASKTSYATLNYNYQLSFQAKVTNHHAEECPAERIKATCTLHHHHKQPTPASREERLSSVVLTM